MKEKRHFKSQEPRSQFANFLDDYLQSAVKMPICLQSRRPHSFRFVPVEQVARCDSSQNFFLEAERVLKEIQIDAMLSLSRASESCSKVSNLSDQLFELVEYLKKLSFNIRSTLEIGYIECREYLMSRILELDKKSPHLPLLKNFNASIRRLQEFSKAYVLYLDDSRESSRVDKSKCFSDLVDEFVQQKKMDIESKRMKQIKKQVSSLLFSRLIRNYLCQVNIKPTQICRLCQQQIPVDLLINHVTSCQNKFQAKQKLQENTFQIKMLIDSLRRKETQILAQGKKFKRTSVCLRLQGKSQSTQKSDESLSKENYSDFVKIQLKILRRMQKVLEGQLSRKLITGFGKDFLMLVQIQKMVNSMRGCKQFNELINKFNKSLTQRQQIKKKLKKTSMNLLREEQVKQTSAKSLNFDMVEIIDNSDWSKRFRSSIKVLSGEQQQQANKRRGFGLKRIHSFVQTWPSVGALSDYEEKFYSENDICDDPFLFQEIEVKTALCLKDFVILKFLGKGAFGKVYLVKRKLTQDLYAMKMVKMENNSSHLLDIVNELDILEKISGQFLVKASFSFTVGCIHFFFLEYMQGGDFSSLLEQQVYLQEKQAKVYIADIILALENLHNLGIIHRDLKPQNLVFDRSGRLKLTDFGLSKSSISKILENTPSQQFKWDDQKGDGMIINRKKNLLQQEQNSRNKGYIIGTPDYIPPEMLLKSIQSSFTIDWWSLGVLIYEILIGERPFGAQTKENVFENILKRKIEWPRIGYGEGMITPESHDLIEKLLDMDPARRLGAQGAHQIKAHKFFEGLDWSEAKNMKKPFPIKFQTNLLFLEEDSHLRIQIQEEIKRNNIDPSQLRDLKKYNLFRTDLLSEQTIRSGDRKQSQLLYFNQIAEKLCHQEIRYDQFL